MEKATFSSFISRNFDFSSALLDFIPLIFACIFFIYTRFFNEPLNAIVVEKYDSVTHEALPGCTFQLRFLGGTSGTGGTVIGQKTTGKNGTCIWTGLTQGTYIVEEISPADGYSIINSSETVYISDKDVNYEDYKGDLYINGEEIDYDVRLGSISHLDGAVLYYTDWNSEKSYGTLKMFKNGTKTKIADDVHDFDITNDGDILYLYDYSTNYYTGTLYLYNNGEPKKIDDDVIALIPVNNYIIRGEDNYGW